MKLTLFLFALLAWPRIGLSQCGAAATGPVHCHTLSAQEIETAIRASVGRPAMEADETFRIEILDQSHALYPDGPVIFPLSPSNVAAPDAVSVLHGYIDTGGSVRHPAWARVRMSIRKAMPVARQELAVGAVLGDEEWNTRQTWVPFPEGASDSGKWDGKTLSGARLKRPVKPDDIIFVSWLEYPLDIRRGQLVDLHIQTGGTHLRLQATALGNARRGETVEVRLQNDRGPALLAVTAGPGRAMVDTKVRGGAADQSSGSKEGQ